MRCASASGASAGEDRADGTRAGIETEIEIERLLLAKPDLVHPLADLGGEYTRPCIGAHAEVQRVDPASLTRSGVPRQRVDDEELPPAPSPRRRDARSARPLGRLDPNTFAITTRSNSAEW